MGGLIDILAGSATSALPQNNGQQQSATTFAPQSLQMPQPLPRMQMPQVQFGKAGNEFQTVGGRKRADKEALFNSIAQMVKAGGDYIQQKKQRTLESTITRLMSAQDGLKEAQAALQQNPNDSKAQVAVKQNTGIINDITSDPKQSKLLQKAFNIDLFGGGKNKQENAALNSAMIKWQQEKAQADKEGKPQPLNPIAQRMQQQQPVRQQMNPQLQQQAQMIQAGLLPKAGEILRANMEAIKLQMEAKTAEARIAGQEKSAQILADARIKGADAVVDAANVRALGQHQAAMIRFKADTIKTNAMLKAVEMRVDAMKEIAGSKSGDKTVGNLVKEANIVKGRAADLAKKRKDMEDQLNKYAMSSGIGGKIMGAVGMGSKSNMTAAQAEQMQKDLFTLKLEQNSVEGQWKDLQMRTNTYIKLGQMPDPDTVSDPEGLFEDEEVVNQ